MLAYFSPPRLTHFAFSNAFRLPCRSRAGTAIAADEVLGPHLYYERAFIYRASPGAFFDHILPDARNIATDGCYLLRMSRLRTVAKSDDSRCLEILLRHHHVAPHDFAKFDACSAFSISCAMSADGRRKASRLPSMAYEAQRSSGHERRRCPLLG